MGACKQSIISTFILLPQCEILSLGQHPDTLSCWQRVSMSQTFSTWTNKSRIPSPLLWIWANESCGIPPKQIKSFYCPRTGLLADTWAGKVGGELKRSAQNSKWSQSAFKVRTVYSFNKATSGFCSSRLRKKLLLVWKSVAHTASLATWFSASSGLDYIPSLHTHGFSR